MRRLYIAGCGYTGKRVAVQAVASGYEVTAQVRNEDTAKVLAGNGIQTICAAVDQLDEIPFLPCADSCLLYSIPPQGGGNIDLRLRNFLAALERDQQLPVRIVYLGASSVYGDTGGEVVDESAVTNPVSAMGKRRLDAELQLHAFAEKHHIPLVLLRIAAIYGPGRLPLMQISQGQPLLHEKEAKLSNRIHVDDLVQVCLAAIKEGSGIYNISDGNPSSMTSYFNCCADALGLPRQPQIDLEEAKRIMPPLLFNYFVESRVLNNSKMIDGLKITLLYPDMQSGVKASAPAAA